MATEREISGKDGVSMAICRPKFAHGIKFAILWAVIISVWMMFAVPVVLYHLQEVCGTFINGRRLMLIILQSSLCIIEYDNGIVF